MSLKSLIRYIIYRVKYFGSQRYCVVCNRKSKEFMRYGVESRQDAACPFCNSVERDRLNLIFLHEQTNLFDGQPKRLLHVAPESAFKKIFSKAVGEGYLTADLMAEDVMEKMDITNIQHPDESFDIIYCSHVLEHVPDDRRAMREFYRCLSQDGWAVINVPITAEKTFEDPSITSREERLRLFGQTDHVRRYGSDYKDRLIDTGFRVAVFSPQDLLSSSEIEYYGLKNPEAYEVYFCTKETGT